MPPPVETIFTMGFFHNNSGGTFLTIDILIGMKAKIMQPVISSVLTKPRVIALELFLGSLGKSC